MKKSIISKFFIILFIFFLICQPIYGKCHKYIINQNFEKAKICYDKFEPYYLEDKLNYITYLCHTGEYELAYIKIYNLKIQHKNNKLVQYFYNVIDDYFIDSPKLDHDERDKTLNNSKHSYSKNNEYCKMGSVYGITIYSQSCYKNIKYNIK